MAAEYLMGLFGIEPSREDDIWIKQQVGALIVADAIQSIHRVAIGLDQLLSTFGGAHG